MQCARAESRTHLIPAEAKVLRLRRLTAATFAAGTLNAGSSGWHMPPLRKPERWAAFRTAGLRAPL